MHKVRVPLALAIILSAAIAPAQTIIRRPTGLPPTDNRDTYQQGMDAFNLKHYRYATRQLTTFLISSTGDPRTDKAAKALREARAGLLKESLQAGRIGEAAALYVALSEDAAKYKESKDTYTKAAADLLSSTFAAAQKKRAFDKVFEAHNAWAKLFPDKPPLMNEEQAAAARLDLLLTSCDDKFNQLTLPDVAQRIFESGGGTPPWEELAKKNRGVPVMTMYFKALADINWAGRYIAEYSKLEADSPIRADKNFAAQTERMFVKRAEASFQQGNIAEARKAIAAAKAETTSSAGQSALKTMESRLPPDVSDALGGKGSGGKLRDLAFKEPIKGKATWADKGEGLGEAKDVVLDDGAEVTVAAGTILNGGRINLRSAKLKLAGEPSKPVTFRNVTIEAEPGGELEAQNALFENCTFSKISTNRSNAPMMNHATHWTFDQSILYRSHFRALSRGSYGLQFTNTAFIESDFPARYTSMEDLAGTYTGQWETIQNCLFLRTHANVSVLWVSKNCNFVACAVNHSDFNSTTGMVIPLYMPDADPLISVLPTRMVEPNTGLVGYAFNRKPYDVRISPTLWALLPADLPDPNHSPSQKRIIEDSE